MADILSPTAPQYTMPNFSGLKPQAFVLLMKSAIRAVFSEDSSSLSHIALSGATQLRLEDPLARWLTHTGGKLVLAVGWELSWGCQPASLGYCIAQIQGKGIASRI